MSDELKQPQRDNWIYKTFRGAHNELFLVLSITDWCILIVLYFNALKEIEKVNENLIYFIMKINENTNIFYVIVQKNFWMRSCSE